MTKMLDAARAMVKGEAPQPAVGRLIGFDLVSVAPGSAVTATKQDALLVPERAFTQLAAVPAGLPSDLLERRPDIRSAEATLEANGAFVKAAKKAYFPTISLTGDFGFQSNALSSLFTGASRGHTAERSRRRS